ncbi:hypothetical protein ABPG74_008855 [Tetrahymena malaccensis]
MNKYISYSKVLKQIAVDKGNFKTVLFREYKGDSKLKEAYGILIKAVKNYDKIVEIGQLINQKEKKNVIGNMQLFCILVIEQFYSKKKKIEGGGQLKKIITENKDFIAGQLNIDQNAENSSNLIKQDVHVRWISKQSTENKLKKEKKESKKKSSEDKMQIEDDNRLQNLMIQKAEPDDIIENLYTLNYNDYQAVISKDSSVLDSTDIVIQSKSSAMPVYLLFKNIIDSQQKQSLSDASRPSKQFDIIDCCSAPGNKTMQAAEYIKGRGKVFAFEKNQQRFELLQERVQKYGFDKVISCLNEDFLSIDVSQYPNVEYFVADPSCSGTGMLNHIYFDEDQIKLEEENLQNQQNKKSFMERTQQIFESYDNKMKQRIIGLGQFQLKILNKLATFPNIKAFSYSTCSIHQQENEDVVFKFLQENKSFELVEACPQWKTRGFKTKSLPDGNKCIRFNPFEDKSDGFFVALFQKK